MVAIKLTRDEDDGRASKEAHFAPFGDDRVDNVVIENFRNSERLAYTSAGTVKKHN